MDVFISMLALAVYAPALAVIALVIRADSPGPVIFLQPRIGIERRRKRVPMPATVERRHVIIPGRPFNIIKLRTMTVDAETDGPLMAATNDVRVTRVGRFLRRSRLDEFPQFVNVLRGEMSVVGPRPERLCFISRLEHDVPGYCRRLDVLPGITGLAQVLNGYDTDVDSVRRKVHLDRQYIDRLSLQTDLRILALTVKVVISGKGAR
jgi:lipopolysaccharide/colanic/teichoic acid biosynthesis glycosyltransferase